MPRGAHFVLISHTYIPCAPMPCAHFHAPSPSTPGLTVCPMLQCLCPLPSTPYDHFMPLYPPLAHCYLPMPVLCPLSLMPTLNTCPSPVPCFTSKGAPTYTPYGPKRYLPLALMPTFFLILAVPVWCLVSQLRPWATVMSEHSPLSKPVSHYGHLPSRRRRVQQLAGAPMLQLDGTNMLPGHRCWAKSSWVPPTGALWAPDVTEEAAGKREFA